MPEALAHVGSGKVRELYDAGPGRLLLVCSDRLSAFDVILPTPIPDKGRVLTGLSLFWFERTRAIAPNHVVSARVADFPEGARDPSLAGRALLVRRLEMLPLECVVRGYLAGSGWRDYQATGRVSGVELPPGLRQADRLPRPVFTPSTKATSGHDENITPEEARELVGPEHYAEAERIALAVYQLAAEHARRRGIVLADTKLELGVDAANQLVVGDELLTPDSSRFWPADAVVVGTSPPSFDKQYVRDWLETQDWDKTPPAPELPPEVAEGTALRYREAYERLCGRPFADYVHEAEADACA